jgi:hypothetical protein
VKKVISTKKAEKPAAAGKKKTSAAKPVVKKTAKTPVIPVPAAPQNLGLPNGSEYQQTGQRRPLIVYPK